VSTLRLWGHYFYTPLVTVGGLNCYMQGSGITSADSKNGVFHTDAARARMTMLTSPLLCCVRWLAATLK
jgi:hypothetical protein